MSKVVRIDSMVCNRDYGRIAPGELVRVSNGQFRKLQDMRCVGVQSRVDRPLTIEVLDEKTLKESQRRRIRNWALIKEQEIEDIEDFVEPEVA